MCTISIQQNSWKIPSTRIEKMLLLTVALICCCSLVSAQTSAPLIGNCYLEGFDLKTLASADHWNFKVDTTDNWLIPEGMNKDQIDHVEVFMSICKPLPLEYCGLSNASSICQRVTFKDGNFTDLEMASYRTDDKFQFLTAEDGVGFYQLQSALTPLNVTRCKSMAVTDLVFRGREFKAWSPQNPDVTDFITLFQRNVEDGCFFEIAFEYQGALFVQPTLAPSSCQLDNYDIQTLAAQEFWWAEVPHTVCYNGTYDQNCYVFFSFCHPLPLQAGAQFDLSTCHYNNAAVCQLGHDKTDNSKVLEYSMGKFKSYTRFFENDYDVGGGFHLDVTNGSRPDNGSICKTNLKTRIILLCNSSAVWPANGDLTKMLHSVYDEQCQYTLLIQYNGACISVAPVVEPESPVGWIFIGLFLFACLLYMLIGMAVQYFVKGARGLDIIPNYKFWTLVLNLIVEGFTFTLNLVTCFKFQKGISRPKGGVQYDQI